MDLEKERESLIAQRDNAYAAYHQAIGAIALLDELIKQQPTKVSGLTVEDIQKAVDSGAATFEPV